MQLCGHANWSNVAHISKTYCSATSCTLRNILPVHHSHCTPLIVLLELLYDCSFVGKKCYKYNKTIVCNDTTATTCIDKRCTNNHRNLRVPVNRNISVLNFFIYLLFITLVWLFFYVFYLVTFKFKCLVKISIHSKLEYLIIVLEYRYSAQP